jgi:GNAT superfamily N-acetyltransferase
MLVEAAIANAKHSGYTKLILWTQSTMTTAQKIYTELGFTQFDVFEKNGRTFKVYEKYL